MTSKHGDSVLHDGSDGGLTTGPSLYIYDLMVQAGRVNARRRLKEPLRVQSRSDLSWPLVFVAMACGAIVAELTRAMLQGGF